MPQSFNSSPKEDKLTIFSPWKIRRFRPGSNPRTWVPEARVLTPRPPKPLLGVLRVQKTLQADLVSLNFGCPKYKTLFTLSSYCSSSPVPPGSIRYIITGLYETSTRTMRTFCAQLLFFKSVSAILSLKTNLNILRK
jgi:hypothetical protein